MAPKRCRSRSPGHGGGRNRDPRGRRDGRRRRGCGLPRLVRGRDGDDRLLGGGHAIYFDGEEAWNLDCFVDVPSGEGAPPVELQRPVRRGARPLRGRAGDVRRAGAPARASARSTGATAACPGRGSSSRRCGWRGTACAMPPAHAACLAMLGAGLHDAARRRADLRAGRPPARDRRDARAAGARDGARAARRRGRRQRLRGLDRRAAARRSRGCP